jgi:hypothetical protein
MRIDVAAQLAGESATEVKTPRDDLTFDFGQPEFDLTEPRAIRGREVEPDAGILLRELP